MPRIASTTTSSTGPAMTLDALMQRQRDLARAMPSPDRQMISPWQGAAYLGDTLANVLQQRRADQQLAEGRQGFAQVMSGIDYGAGPTGEQISQAMLYDPDAATRLADLRATIEQRRVAREQELADLAANRAYEEQQTTAGRIYEAGQEAKINERERLEQIEKEKREAAANPPETFRPPTQEEIDAYGLKPDQPVRVNTKTNKIEAIGGGPSVQLLPSEVGARLGLADEFLANFDTIRASAEAGEMTGLIDQPMSVMFGRGPGGEKYRQLRQGTEGLMRLMTGAGMPVGEARDRALQYEPQITDDAATLVSKLDGLKAAIESVRSGATAGRTFPGQPATAPAAGGGLPTPQTQEEFDALPSGTRYIDPDDGKEYVK